MKKTFLDFLSPVKGGYCSRILLVLLISTLNACSKNDQPKDPVDTLPPITQTGEDTFACLINGKPFFSSRNRGASFYNGSLGISGSRRDEQGIRSIVMYGWEVGTIKAGTFPLKSEEIGNFSANYLIDGGLSLDATTIDSASGHLNITRFDPKELIVSGTFEFTVLDNDGNPLNFTDGRFDLNYK